MKLAKDIQSKNSDSLTNFFDYSDESCHVVEKHEEPVTDGASISTLLMTGEENAKASFTIMKATERQSLLDEPESSVEMNLAEETDLSHKDDKLSEMQEVEQNETNENAETEIISKDEVQLHDEANLEIIYTTDVASTESKAREVSSADLPACESTELQDVQKENDESSQLAIASESLLNPDAESCTAVETTDVETSDKMKPQDFETANLLIHAVSTTSPDFMVKSAEGVEPETPSKHKVDNQNDEAHLGEISTLDVASTDLAAKEILSSAYLPTSEPTELEDVQNEKDEITPASSQMVKGAEPHWDKDREIAVEPSDFTAVEEVALQLQGLETTNLLAQTMSTTSADCLEMSIEAAVPHSDKHSEVGLTVELSDSKADVEVEPQDLEKASLLVQTLSTASPEFTDKLLETIEPPPDKDTDVIVEQHDTETVVEVEPQDSETANTLSVTSTDFAEKITEAVESPAYIDIEVAVEPSGAEAAVEVEPQDSETASLSFQALPITSPYALRKNAVDTELVGSNGLEAMVSEQKPVSSKLNLGLAEQSDIESNKVDESLEKVTNPDLSASDKPSGFEDGHVHLDQLESIADTTAATAATAEDDAAGEKIPEPQAQSVLSARDAFVEQQVNK